MTAAEGASPSDTCHPRGRVGAPRSRRARRRGTDARTWRTATAAGAARRAQSPRSRPPGDRLRCGAPCALWSLSRVMTCARAMAGAACRASGISGILRRRRRLCDGKETGEGGSGVSWTAGVKKSRKKSRSCGSFTTKVGPNPSSRVWISSSQRRQSPNLRNSVARLFDACRKRVQLEGSTRPGWVRCPVNSPRVPRFVFYRMRITIAGPRLRRPRAVGRARPYHRHRVPLRTPRRCPRRVTVRSGGVGG